jgi:anti-sigma-K factor RskA
MNRDEQIAAFLDGRLSGQELRVFEAELESDPGLAAEVARIAGNDDLLRAAFDAPMHEPVDKALIERMGLGVASPVAASAANDNPPFWRRWQLPVGGAIAASLALAMVLQLGGGSNDAFSVAMETTPSLVAASLGDQGIVTPQLTFAANDGRFCREFLKEGGAAETGIACRSDGKWKIEARVKGGFKLQDSGEIATAAGADGTSLDSVYERLGASDPLDAASEKALIEGKWAKR